MNGTRSLFSIVMAGAGAVLPMGAIVILGLVFDFAPWLLALLLVAGGVAGAWYGWRLGKTVPGSSARTTSSRGRRHHR
ncbi:MAG: hypothetical protein ACRDJ9_12355 [Dehalococcoidia bacterium]